MQYGELLIPKHIQGISVDLWGTLFFDSHYADNLQKSRIILLAEKARVWKCDLNEPPLDKMVAEKKRFLESEKSGDFLPLFERVSFLTEYKISKEQTQEFMHELALVSTKFVPELNVKLVDRLKSVKHKYKLALISNTGMISAADTRKMIKQMGIDELFDELIFSEELLLCKPSPAVYHEASRRLNIPVFCLLHIGDSYQNDYIAALDAGCNALWFSGKKYER